MVFHLYWILSGQSARSRKLICSEIVFQKLVDRHKQKIFPTIKFKKEEKKTMRNWQKERYTKGFFIFSGNPSTAADLTTHTIMNIRNSKRRIGLTHARVNCSQSENSPLQRGGGDEDSRYDLLLLGGINRKDPIQSTLLGTCKRKLSHDWTKKI